MRRTGISGRVKSCREVATITQQLIKILYLERERTWKRKIQEAGDRLLAGGGSSARTRSSPLSEQHLSRSGRHGVPGRRRIYFDKDVKELDIR